MNRDDLQHMRQNYQRFELSVDSLAENPMAQFSTWLDEAIAEGFYDANAMVLSTVDAENFPQSRIVLLKGLRPDGFLFYTNYNSHKGRELDNSNKVALNFWWDKMERQVRITGTVRQLSYEENNNYFHQRPKDSQLGAMASKQSQNLNDYQELIDRFDRLADEFKDQTINCPDYWGGYIVEPVKIEFWQGRPNRLHDRILYTRNDSIWTKQRLNP